VRFLHMPEAWVSYLKKLHYSSSRLVKPYKTQAFFLIYMYIIIGAVPHLRALSNRRCGTREEGHRSNVEYQRNVYCRISVETWLSTVVARKAQDWSTWISVRLTDFWACAVSSSVVFLSLPPSRSLLHPSTLSFIPSFTYLLVVSPVLTTPQVRASEEDEKEGDVVEDGEGINTLMSRTRGRRGWRLGRRRASCSYVTWSDGCRAPLVSDWGGFHNVCPCKNGSCVVISHACPCVLNDCLLRFGYISCSAQHWNWPAD
jgi:hypothetical protein